MKFKLIAALFGLMVALPGAVFAQNADDQAPYEDSKPSPNIQMQGPTDSGSDQDALNSGSLNSGSSDSAAADQTQNTSAPEEKNGVARVSLIHGDVSTQRGDNGSWSAAALNAPVLAGDRVSTGDKARTELQLDYANMLRLSEDSQANINTLSRSQIQVQLGRGMANYSVFKNSDADAEIDTPNVAIRTGRRESSFRILVTADDHTEILVRRGEVEVTTPQGGTRVTQGQFITIQGTGDQEQYKIGEAPARDDWDQWNTDRDNVIRNAASRQRTNDYYVGVEDLDGHGTWSEVPDYGPVWRPTVSDPDWAPYRDGRWVYQPYWGWTWVSYDSWGWAPYHYGRWMYVDGGWGWWPGPVYGYPYYRPIWAPAYVSFFGYGAGFGFGFGFGGGWGSVGWLPLGPCDHFHPWYGRWGGRYGDRNFRDFNRGGFAPLHGGNRFSNVNLALNDRHFRGATSVSGHEFGKGRMSARPMNHAQFQNARFSSGRLPVNPSRESYSASGRPAAPSTTRNVSQTQRFFSARGGNSASNPRLFERPQSPASNGNRQDGRLSGNGRDSSLGNNNSNARSSNGFQRFNQSGQNNVSGSRSAGMPNNSQSRPEPRGNSTMRESGNGNGGGWQKFSPMPSRSSSDSARPQRSGQNDPAGRPSQGGQGYSAGRPSQDRPSQDRMEGRGSYGSPRSSSPQGQGRGYSSDSRGYGGYSRPPLNMRQPIVTPRSYGGGSYGRGSYGGDRGGYSGGGRPSSAPSYGRPSAPSYGGGGGRSAPSFGGGGHSAPSGGSSRGGGGSSHGGGGSSHGGGAPSHGGGGGKHGR